MTSLTERYLAAVLGSIPESNRADVEQELRSSIADAVEERTATGEDRLAAERAVLEGLGDPAQLAAGYSGKPNYLIGPELFPVYRWFIPRLLGVVVPIATLGIAVAEVATGGNYGDALGAAIDGAITVALQLLFWTTATFVFLERAESARDARAELTARTGAWTVDRLPEVSPPRMTAGETVSEVITAVLTIGGLIFLRGLTVPDASGTEIPLFGPAFSDFWYSLFIAVLAAQGILHVIAFAMGRWTMPLAVVFTALQLTFAVPLLWLALNGSLINPAFAQEIGWPQLAEADGLAMVAVAVVTTVVTAWEIASVFVRAHSGRPLSSFLRTSRRPI